MNFTLDDYNSLGVGKYITPYIDWLNQYSETYLDNTPETICSFLANVMSESGNFQYSQEIASGVAYEGRRDLGNIQKGDGVRFKGRGLIELTGRYEYRQFTDWCQENGYNVDFIANPSDLELPQWAVLSAIWYWQHYKLSDYTFQQACSRINTGSYNSQPSQINGWQSRLNNYNKVEGWLKNIINET